MAISTTAAAPAQPTTTKNASESSTTAATADTRRHQDFLQLFLAQVTQQDPMEPMKNSELMEQIIGIETIERLGKLDDGLQTLQRVDLAQGASLVGQSVTLNDGGTGRVDKVMFKDGQTYVVVGGQELPLSDITSLDAPTT